MYTPWALLQTLKNTNSFEEHIGTRYNVKVYIVSVSVISFLVKEPKGDAKINSSSRARVFRATVFHLCSTQ